MSKTRWRMPLTIVLLILLGSSLSNQTVSTIKAKQSCLDHYLAGESGTEVNRNVILPIATTGSDADNTYFIECRMPKSAQPHLLVESVVKNGLEQWHGIRSGEKRTIGYQVRDKHLMERLLKDSDTCEQTITVDWNEWIAYEAFKLANQQPFYGTASSETEEPFEDADPPFFQKVNQKHNFNYPNQFKLNLEAKSSDE
uniref:Signal peptide protein n=1 Tax=Rhabditophanes sp. KR3021 TaxID=114890 RepID=A0AC35TSZ2_9BILA